MTLIQQVIAIAVAAVTNFLTRLLPFKIFIGNGKKDVSPFIRGLGNFLPAAIMTMLAVYCFRTVNFLASTHGLPQIIAGVVTVVLHLWKQNLILSMVGGTVCYILLVNFVF